MKLISIELMLLYNGHVLNKVNFLIFIFYSEYTEIVLFRPKGAQIVCDGLHGLFFYLFFRFSYKPLAEGHYINI